MSVKTRPRDGTWFYRFNQDRQTYQGYGYATAKLAKAAENTRIKEIQDGKKTSSSDFKQLSIRDAAQAFYDNHAIKLEGWYSYKAQLVVIAEFFRNKRLVDLTKDNIRDFCEHVRTNVKTKVWKGGEILIVPISEHTVQHYFTAIKTIINWWIKEKGFNLPNIAAQIKLKEIPKARVRFLYPSEEKILTPAVEKDGRIWKHYYTALETGLRQWNLCSMKVMDIDFTLNKIFIPISKNGRSGYVPISDRLRLKLIEWTRGKQPTDFALGNIQQTTVSHAFTDIVRAAKIEDFTFHDLRHTFAYNLLRQGEPIYIVSKLLLHRNVKTTEEHYGHLAVSDLGTSVNRVNGIISVSREERVNV